MTLFILIYTKKINCRTRHWWKTKRKKSAKWISTVQCTQEPHGMTLRNHTNSLPWMLTVTSTSYMNDHGHINSVPEWTRSHLLHTVNERGHTNSVPWMHAVCRLHKATFIQTNCVHSWYGVGVTAFIHGTELMRFGKVALRSTKISIKWLWPVKVTLEVIKWRTIVFCWSCDEGHLNWDKKNFPSLQFTNTDRISILSTPPPNGRSMPLSFMLGIIQQIPYIIRGNCTLPTDSL